MKKFNLLSLFSLLLLSQYSYSQGCFAIEYTYDQAGNRFFRQKVPITCKLAAPGSEQDTNLKFTADLEQCKVTIFPNPTKGILKISLDGLNADMPSQLSLYTINGSLVKTISPAKSYFELDMVNQPYGVYFLRITANAKTTEWKVVRE